MIGGLEHLITDPRGLVALPTGEHDIAWVTEDGVGPLLRRTIEDGSFLTVRHAADDCADAARARDALDIHLARLQARLPKAELHVVHAPEGSVKDIQLWSWDGEALVERGAMR